MTDTARRPASLSMLAAIAASLLLAGCSALPVIAGGGSGGDPMAEPGTGDAPAEGSAEPGDGAEVGLDECLVADWRLVNESWSQLVNAALAGEDGSVTRVEGETHLVLEGDGSYRVEYREWLVEITAEGGGFITTRRGADAGTWSLSNDVVTLATTTPGSTLESYVMSDDTRIPLPAGTGSRELGLESFSALCAEGELLATIPEGVLVLLSP